MQNFAQGVGRSWLNYGVDMVWHDGPGAQFITLMVEMAQSAGHQIGACLLAQVALAMTLIEIFVYTAGIPVEECFLLVPSEGALNRQSLSEDGLTLLLELVQQFTGESSCQAKGDEVGSTFTFQVR